MKKEQNERWWSTLWCTKVNGKIQCFSQEQCMSIDKDAHVVLGYSWALLGLILASCAVALWGDVDKSMGKAGLIVYFILSTICFVALIACTVVLIVKSKRLKQCIEEKASIHSQDEE